MHNIPSLLSYNINAFRVSLAGKENLVVVLYVVGLALTQSIARIDVSKSEIDI